MSEPCWKDYIEYISVSQIRTHDRNPRRWALEKLLKLPTTDSPATKIGSDAHSAIEDVTLNGPNHAKKHSKLSQDIVRDWLAHAEIQPDMIDAVEQSIHIENSAMPPLIGYIDGVVKDYQGYPMIIDYKTSRTRRYFLTEEQLAEDIQLLTYAYWVFHYTRYGEGADHIWLQHTQIAYSLKRRKTRECRVLVSREHVEHRYADLIARIKPALIETITKYHFEGIHALSTEACGQCNNSFGPNSCEYYDICSGRADPEDYKAAYAKVKQACGEVQRYDLREALTEIGFDAIIEEKEEKMPLETTTKAVARKHVELWILMKSAREQTTDMSNVWDRREAMTKSIVNYIKKEKFDFVIAPSHFIGGSIDPDYGPLITQLKELGITVFMEL